MAQLTEHRGFTVYTIDLPGFEGVEFSQSSESDLYLPDAVNHLPEFGSVLASADDELVFRMAANGKDHANKYRINRTGTFRFLQDGKVRVAADDSADPLENLLLSRAQEGYDLHRAGKEWLLSIDDPVVKATIARATQAGRVYDALNATNCRGLSLDGTYRNDPAVRAIIPKTAATYEKWLREHSFTNGYVGDLSDKECINAGLDNTTVLARRVGVGGGSDFYLDVLGAYVLLYDSGRARRVREKFQRK